MCYSSNSAYHFTNFFVHRRSSIESSESAETRGDFAKAQKCRSSKDNPTGFNHRPIRVVGIAVVCPFDVLLPLCSVEISRLLSSAGETGGGGRGNAPRGRRIKQRAGGGRGRGPWRVASDRRRYADRSLSRTRRRVAIDISREGFLSIGAPPAPPRPSPLLPTPPRYLYPPVRRKGGGYERSYVDEGARARARIPLVLSRTAAEKINFRFVAIYNFL